MLTRDSFLSYDLMNISKSYFPLIVLLASSSLQFEKCYLFLGNSTRIVKQPESTVADVVNETERTQEAHVVLFVIVIRHSSHVFVWRCKVEEQTECHTEAMTSQLVFILHIYLPETFEGNAMVFLYCNYGRMSRESLTTETYVFGEWKFLCITELIQNQRNFDKRGKIQVKELIKLNFKAFFCYYEVQHL